MVEIIITRQNENGKLKKLCFKYFDKAPQSFIYKMLRKKNIVLNDKRATGEEILTAGDSVKLYVSDDTIAKLHTSIMAEGSFGRMNDLSGNAPARSHKTAISVKDMIIKETGDYLILVGGIYDDRFLVKPVKSAVTMMPEASLELPYEGAKEMLLVDNVENKVFLRNLLEVMYEELPAPKKKK